MTEELRCPYCNKSCNSKSGLTLHRKKCSEMLAASKVTAAHSRTVDPRDIDPRSTRPDPPCMPAAPRQEKPIRTPAVAKSKPLNGQFDFGAFVVFEHLMIMLDLNFASALADHILKHGSDNKAILAFGHQLAKVSGDD